MTKTKAKVVEWKARPTTYRGIQMRSRLEAAWAEQFTATGENWDYEPKCFASDEGQYLPDFVWRWSEDQPLNIYIEVKPFAFLQTPGARDELSRMLRIIQASEPTSRLWLCTSAGPDRLVRMAWLEQSAACPSCGKPSDVLRFLCPPTPLVASLHADGFYDALDRGRTYCSNGHPRRVP